MKILVPIDYSKEACHAMKFAMEIAQREKAEIILFHAFSEPISVDKADYIEEAIEALEKEKTKVLEEYVQEVKYDLGKDFVLTFTSSTEAGVTLENASNLTKSGFHVMGTNQWAEIANMKINCMCKFGLPDETILAVGEAYQVDIIIMGMRGAGTFCQAFLDSTVASVIQAGKLPVLALPLEAVPKENPVLVFAIDLSLKPKEFILKQLCSFVKILRANLKILHIYQDSNPEQEEQQALAALEILDKLLNDISYEVYFRQHDDVVAGIEEFLKAQKADFIALVPKHHSFFEILLQETITGFMTERAQIPLLTIPATLQEEPIEL